VAGVGAAGVVGVGNGVRAAASGCGVTVGCPGTGVAPLNEGLVGACSGVGVGGKRVGRLTCGVGCGAGASWQPLSASSVMPIAIIRMTYTVSRCAIQVLFL
jgi:hypothetical protein